ncbi:APA family basic amino acid/polyamine antiporter [Scopulibacillus daqui]|uniref:APA family basic amino acid/polyamine antiporter n=1 Tax=Scopulibacillus daqui TaxID=1469162 RepID=A0ABS2PYN9_9BACL|nr:amino acid permease [Scopulibacillus daqui]MBM7645140.1 APA family basic amino acid/polyamine antiporter [Scopulibacillus daqui]
MNNDQQLRRNIGLSTALSIVIGTVIGSGIFMKPGQVIDLAGSAQGALWAWALGGIITICGGLTVSELSTQIPKTGGLYVYMEEIYGKIIGYLSGWVQTIIYGPTIIGALGLYFGSLLANLFGLSHIWITIFGISAVLFLAIMNSIGTKFGGVIQTAATIGKMVPVILIVVFGLWKGQSSITGIAVSSSHGGIGGMGAAILATLFAYDGWMLISLVAGEMKNPQKVLPKAITIGLSVVTFAYLAVNFALLHILSPNTIVHLNENAAGKAASIVLGGVGGKIINIGILISIFGCLNGKILTFPRIPYAMAVRGELPFSGLISRIHKRFATPAYAIFLEVLISLLFICFSDPDQLSQIAVFVIYIFYILSFIAVFILRKRNKGIKRPYSVPLYPIIPIIAIAGSSYIVLSTIFTSPKDSLYSIGLMLTGLPVYWLLRKQMKRYQSKQESEEAAG